MQRVTHFYLLLNQQTEVICSSGQRWIEEGYQPKEQNVPMPIVNLVMTDRSPRIKIMLHIGRHMKQLSAPVSDVMSKDYTECWFLDACDIVIPNFCFSVKTPNNL